MAETTALPEPDRVDGAPHPRETQRLFGHAAAERAVLEAWASGRMHHAWLLTGPRGVGKATLAWRMARFLLATPPPQDDGLFGAPPPPDTLDIDPDHPVARRLVALSEPGLHLVRRGGSGGTESEQQKNLEDGKFSAFIRVDEVRRLAGFFHLSASDGGRRVVIVDSADELNPNAANALLKMLEEPPPRATLILVSHQPARLLPTIRSRCRLLRLATLGPEDMQAALAQAGVALAPETAAPLASLAEGAVGTALALHRQEGLALYGEILTLLASLPRLDRPRLLALADSCSGKAQEPRFALVMTLAERLVARLARTGVTGTPPEEISPGEAAILNRLAPDAASGRMWAERIQAAGDRARHARGVNVPAEQIVTDFFLHLGQARS